MSTRTTGQPAREKSRVWQFVLFFAILIGYVLQ
jgi:hypothetical protein